VSYDATAGANISRVQNVDRIATSGLEAALTSEDLFFKGFDLQASLTYTDSKITANRGYVKTPGDTVGRWQPNIPRWRATLLGAYRFNDQTSASLGLRHSGKQYRLLNNTDVNGQTYMCVSQFTVLDLRVRHRFDKQWSASFGIDNLTNKQYWNFHPYPQRSYSAEVSFDL
jgi:iron complex outermembrane receptor protein